MIPVDQNVFNTEETVGNCFAAALASILEIPISEIPHFADHWFSSGIEDGGERTEIFWFRVTHFMARRGLRLYLKPFDKVEPDEFCIMIGKSPRYAGWYHAVVYQNGKMVHDPHPSRDGILSEEYCKVVRRID